MNLPPLPLIDDCLFIDNSGWLELMQTCYRKLEYQQLYKRVSAADKPSLSFGTAVHSALEYRYIKYRNQPADIFCDQDIAELLRAHFDEHPCPDGDFRTLNWCVEIVRRYNEKYAIEPFNLLEYDEPIDCPFCHNESVITDRHGMVIDALCSWCDGTGKRTLMIELPFAISLATLPFEDRSIRIFYTGRIDLPNYKDGQLFVTDHKTTSLLGPSFFDRMKMSSQQKGYAWAFSALTGMTVSGYEINAIRTKEPPAYVTHDSASRSGKRQSPDEWWNESFQREKYYLKPGELEEWRQNTICMVEEMLWHHEKGYMPMKTAWCAQYGRCPYYDVCTLDRADRGVMLASGLFTDNTWSPLNQIQQQQTTQQTKT